MALWDSYLFTRYTYPRIQLATWCCYILWRAILYALTHIFCAATVFNSFYRLEVHSKFLIVSRIVNMINNVTYQMDLWLYNHFISSIQCTSSCHLNPTSKLLTDRMSPSPLLIHLPHSLSYSFQPLDRFFPRACDLYLFLICFWTKVLKYIMGDLSLLLVCSIESFCIPLDLVFPLVLHHLAY